MKALGFFLLIIAFGFAYDDYSKRDELTKANLQVEELTQERDAATKELEQIKAANPRQAQPGHATPQSSQTPSSPNWFQQRLQEKPTLNPPPSKLGSPSLNKPGT